jgi:hypothetical protein
VKWTILAPLISGMGYMSNATDSGLSNFL